MPMAVGLASLALLVGGVGAWSVRTEIAGAVVAPGTIELESNRQVVQHPEGGVVGAILVKDGAVVEAGEVLVRFDNTLLASEFAIVDSQLDEIGARSAMHAAERDDAEAVVFPPELLALAAERPDLARQLEAQRDLFAAQRDTDSRALEQIAEQQAQIENVIKGTEAQLAGLRIQQELVAEERADAETLLEKGLIQLSRVLALRREDARLIGEIGRIESEIARSRGQIAALEIEKLKLGTARREQAIGTLRDLQFQEIELRERALSLRERLGRMEVRAPVPGVVYGSRVFALKSVIQPAEPMMYIIPQDQPLVVASRIEATQIDQVFVGQAATMRFSAFDQRTTPELAGTITEVSADVFTDEATGYSFYRAEVLPDPGEIEKLGGLSLLPGMPVETFLGTGERTPLSYLVKPLSDYFTRAMRED